MGLLRYLFTPLGLVLVGLIAGGGGGWMVYEGHTGKTPERAELTRLIGAVTNITKKWTEKRGMQSNVKFEIILKPAEGSPKPAEGAHLLWSLTVPERHMMETEAPALYHGTVTALIRGTDGSDVWELTAGSRVFIAYDKSRKEHVEYLASLAKNGPYVAGGGVLAFLLGATWFLRRRTADAIA